MIQRKAFDDALARLRRLEHHSAADLGEIAALKAGLGEFKAGEFAALEGRVAELEHGLEALAASIGVSVKQS